MNVYTMEAHLAAMKLDCFHWVVMARVGSSWRHKDSGSEDKLKQRGRNHE